VAFWLFHPSIPAPIRETSMPSRPVLAGPAGDISISTPWEKFLAFLLRRRVRITVILFALLLIEDVWDKTDPHDLANLSDFKVVLGLGLVFVGLALRSWAAGTLHKRTELTVSGPYGLIRHPLYTGSFMMMLGFCQLVDDAENIWFVVGPVLALYIYRAIVEERFLAEKFPDHWAAFARKVPRFFPRKLPRQLFSSWNLKQWIHNREYQAVSAVCLGLVALQIWHSIETP
jgi:protein-S-isoprenylcysteine O-methyltransferase Ste14